MMSHMFGTLSVFVPSRARIFDTYLMLNGMVSVQFWVLSPHFCHGQKNADVWACSVGHSCYVPGNKPLVDLTLFVVSFRTLSSCARLFHDDDGFT